QGSRGVGPRCWSEPGGVACAFAVFASRHGESRPSRRSSRCGTRRKRWSAGAPWNPPSIAPGRASARRRSCPPPGSCMASPFAHLHVHSHYSLMRGTERLEALADAARQRGMDRFALTDTNALYGFVFYRQICDEWGLKPIAGAEVVEAAPSGRGAAHGEGPARAVLLARGREGYRSLCHILTARHLDPSFSLERAVHEHAASLVLLSEQRPLLSALRDALPVYAELVPGRGDRPLLHWPRAQEVPR